MNHALRRTHLRYVASALLVLSTAGAATRAQDTRSTEQTARDAEVQRRRLEEADARIRRMVTQFATRARETKTLVETLTAKLKDLNDRIAAMQKDDDGKRLALDDTAFEGLVRMIEEPFVTTGQVQAKKVAIDLLLEGLEKELKRDAVGYVPSDQTVDEVDKVHYWARERLNYVDEKSAWLTLIASQAPADVDLAKLPTLEHRIQADRAARERAKLEALRRGQEAGLAEASVALEQSAKEAAALQGKAEAERKLREALAEVERLKTELDIRLKLQREEMERQQAAAEQRLQDALAEIERQKKLADAERRARDAAAEIGAKTIDDETRKKQLSAKCDDPEVRSLLSPFLSDGYWQPAGSGIEGRKSTTKGGMSLKAMAGYGALAPTDDGIAKLWRIACSPRNDRPHWSGTSANESTQATLKRISSETMENVKKARDLLNELGPTLVERGLLQE